jgi:ShK domain-like
MSVFAVLVTMLLLVDEAEGTATTTTTSSSSTKIAVAAHQAKARGECIPTSIDYSTFHCYDTHDEDREDSMCVDRDADCRAWSERGECQNNAAYMLANCASSCDACVNGHAGIPQVAPAAGNLRRVLQRLEQTKAYLQRKVLVNARYLLSCTNSDPLCTHWATLGECERNPTHMQSKCPAACRRC